MKKQKEKMLLVWAAWGQALVATMGSLYFSEIKGWEPCKLCWFQRILMYPLVLVIAVGLVSEDKKIYRYVLPLSLLGGAIAFYHNLLYWGIIPEGSATCSASVSCTVRQGGWFGFVTIPLLSLTAFVVISGLMAWYRKRQK